MTRAIASASFLAYHQPFNVISNVQTAVFRHTEQIIIFPAYIMLIYEVVDMVEILRTTVRSMTLPYYLNKQL